MKIIIFDFEVFKFDCLLGCKIIENKETKVFQTWDLEEIKNFYEEHKFSYCWIGHNIVGYDLLILEAILKDKDPYQRSLDIIENDKRGYPRLPLVNYDLMGRDYYSLKVTEAVAGENISESEIDFKIQRPLTPKEKKDIEIYNLDDLNRTEKNLLDPDNFSNFRIKLDFLKTFQLPYKALNYTGTKLSELALNAVSIPGIEYQYIKPPIYKNLILKNKELWNFYTSEGFRKKGLTRPVIKIGNAEITIGRGGVHSAIPRYHTKKALYFDVSGYYNLVMINYDLLPRTIGEEGKKQYIDIYHKQLEYKITDPKKREPLKIILLSVFGAEMNEYSQFYDPQRGSLVTITGQLFICDLLEKLEDKVIIVQSNTDGIIVEPINWNDEKEIIQIVEEWEKRTGFVIKKDYIYNLWQRDVNNYMYKDKKGEIHVLGEALKGYATSGKLFFEGKPSLDFKEPHIIAKSIVNYLMFDKWPEETINENKDRLIDFQYICKRKSYDYTEYELKDLKTGKIEYTKLQGVNRVFAYKDNNYIGMIYKHKERGGKKSKAKVSNLPPSVFVYDNEILSDKAIKEIQTKINYNYYIERSYERIFEFIDSSEEEINHGDK